MKFKRTKSKCKDCPLRDRTKVYGEGPDDPKILFIGEAPGRDEDRLGKPFVGAAGHYFNWGLGQANILRHRTWITNLLSCRPPDNEITSYEAKEALKCCEEGFWEEIDWVLSRGIRVITPLGGVPLSYFNKEHGITEARGSVFQFNELPVVPTFHPSYLNRMTYKKADSSAKPHFKYVWISDLKKIKDISENGWEPPKEHFNLFPTIDDIANYVDARIKEKALVAVDIEATSLNPKFGEIVVIGLAHSSTEALSIPFRKQFGSYYWSPVEESQVRMFIKALLKNCPLIFQNALFDVRYLIQGGFDINYENIKYDTLLLHHAYSPELPHNLAFIVSLYGDTPYWKADFLKRDGSILDMQDEILRTYNLRDCVVLHQVLPSLLFDLGASGTMEIYEKESQKLLKPVIKMIENGVKIDEKRILLYAQKLFRTKTSIKKQLLLDGSLPKIFNPSSPDDLRYFLFGKMPSKLRNVEERLASKQRTDTKIYRNLQDLKKLKDKVKPIYVPMKFSGRKTPTRKVSTDKQGLLSLQVILQNRLNALDDLRRSTEKHKEEKEKVLKLLKWLARFNEYKRIDKLISTYSHFPRDPDGRTRANFNIAGTATGRFSSSKPNLQNQPKDDPEIRKAFIADEGNIILASDYSNLEVRVLAYETRDKELIKFLETGGNIHDRNTEILFKIKPSNPLWESARAAAKTFFFGGIAYGGGDREIYEKVILKCPTLNLTFADFKIAKANYYKAYPLYHKWREGMVKSILSTRRVDSFSGRKRYLLGFERDIIKEGLNFPIQSGAASIINQAMIRIDNIMEKKNLKSKLVLQVHDELVFEVLKSELRIMKTLVKAEMEREVNFRGQMISFPVEMKTGPSWGELK